VADVNQKGMQLERVGGWHAVQALLERQSSRVRVVHLLTGRDDARAQGIAQLAQRAGIALRRGDAATLDKLAGGVTHQGVLAEIEPLKPWTEEDLLAAVAAAPAPPLLLALDGVQDPHNLGACLRTADACGALAVIVPRDRAAQLNPTVRKVAAGAAETTPVVPVVNLVRCLKLLKQANLWVVGAAGEAPKAAHETDLSGGIVLVMGAEAEGLRHLTRQTCDLLVSLPQRGTVESLNVSVAAGMLLYEALRQRLAQGR
jgi:23S rRNA (guanosine2251-2'-O)-methyltransferase